MPIRTTPQAVQAILLDEYDIETAPDLTPFIAAASGLVDVVIQLAAQRAGYGGQFGYLTALNSLTSDQQYQVETWLAAHFYQQPDPGYSNRSTEGASGGFTGQFQMSLDNTRYGQQAQLIDTTGILKGLMERKFASAMWLGKIPSQQIPYVERE